MPKKKSSRLRERCTGNGECKGHPFNCFNHPHDCGCQSVQDDDLSSASHTFLDPEKEARYQSAEALLDGARRLRQAAAEQIRKAEALERQAGDVAGV